ncbi:MAG: chromosome partitioning protein ParB, partial [Phycisphaerae bacterium]|nr:chromosome partitioning protein ParB [Phycisphaerae bacterium]
MKIEMKAIDAIKPYEANPRNNDAAVDAVARSISDFGFRQPIVIDGDGIIVCGHTRFKAAQQLELSKVPVHIARDLTPEQVRAYRLADNRTAELAQWDRGLLEVELEALCDLGYEISDLAAFGFDDG